MSEIRHRFNSAGDPSEDRTARCDIAIVHYDAGWLPAEARFTPPAAPRPWASRMVIAQINWHASTVELNPGNSYIQAKPYKRISEADAQEFLERYPDRMTSPYMRLGDPVPDGAVCENCGEHPAAPNIYAPGGVMEANHGHFMVWCECCILHDAIQSAEEQAARLPGLRAGLAVSACRGSGTEEVGP